MHVKLKTPDKQDLKIETNNQTLQYTSKQALYGETTLTLNKFTISSKMTTLKCCILNEKLFLDIKYELTQYHLQACL